MTYESFAANFAGRVSRMNFFLGTCVFFVVFGFLSGVSGVLVALSGLRILAALLGIVSLLVSLAVMVFGASLLVRRLHDLGNSGWLALLMLIPYLNAFFLLYLLLAPGKKESNKYGDSNANKPFSSLFVCKAAAKVEPVK